MATLNKSDVLHVASLANLKLTEEEIEKFGAQLSKIIDYIGHLDEVDIKGVEPTAQVTGLENVYAEDEIKAGNILAADEALSGTDKTYNGYFKVDAILEGRTDK